MRPIAPRIHGLEEVQIDGERYKVLPAAVGESDEGRSYIVTRWRLSDEERGRIVQGEDVFMCLAGPQMQPVQIHIGWPYGDLET